MCQMCDEYENELVRMGLIEDAKKFREERQQEHEAAAAATGQRQTINADTDLMKIVSGHQVL